MYSAKNELKFTYRIISNKEFDVSKLKQQFPILSKKEALKINKPYLTIQKEDGKFIVCIQKLYISIGNIDTKLLIDLLNNIKTSLKNEAKIDIVEQLIISVLPETDQFGIDIPIEILRYLSENNINLTLSGIFL
ncbi:hypothetical protein [Campylobacter concisus]|uniref:hypothetical protein n=1 Tax=Campylobacter concisus TaxID=199 RepID=UPI000555B572|nr:hypothetical protein [Campylobacter concisus]